MPSGTRDRYAMEKGRVERLYVELTIKERKAKEFATFQEAKALKAGDRVKSGLEAKLTAGERIGTKAEETAMLKQDLAREAGQLYLLVKEKEHAKPMELNGLFKAATAAAKKAIEDAAKKGTLKGEAKANSLVVVIFYFFCKQPFYIERKGMDGWPKERETYCRRVLFFFGGLRQGLKKKRKEKSLNNT